MATYSRLAVVTGGASGLGLTMVNGLLAAGHRVAVVDRDAQRLSELAQNSQCENLSTFEADLSLPTAAEVISRIEAAQGPVDILVNNAGVGQAQIRSDYHVNKLSFDNITYEQWSLACNVNTTAVFLLSKAVAAGMKQRGWGRIINITTSLGTMLRPGWVPYGPSKAAAEALSAGMAGDLEGTGVTVNVITPGGIANTGMIPRDAPYDRSALVQPEIMLPPLLWLVSDEAGQTTGMRFVGTSWETSKGSTQAAHDSMAPIGWRALAAMPVTPIAIDLEQ